MTPRCAACTSQDCRDGKDCLDTGDQHRLLYEDARVGRLHQAASAIEARHYCKEPRVTELILFIKELGLRRVGLAFCVGLASEAAIIAGILSRYVDVASVCCKVSGITKRTLGLEQIKPEKEKEITCNPAGQAQLLNEAGTELNILCGLCVGHDAIFSTISNVPVTTLIVKDRVLAHNPIGAVYCQYLRREFEGGPKD